MRSMRKLIIGLCAATFLPLAAEASVSFRATEFRWRYDDGTETSAKWMAPANFGATAATSRNIRLRLSVSNPQGATTPVAMYLQYNDTKEDVNTSAAGDHWKNVPATATTQAFEMASSPYFANGDATTDQLRGTNRTFQAGYMVEAPSTQTPAISMSVGNYNNVEFCIRPTAYAVTNLPYTFRLCGAYNAPGGACLILMPETLGDVNRDGVVNADDLNEVISNFGKDYR